jgi:hypothetical protein
VKSLRRLHDCIAEALQKCNVPGSGVQESNEL